jgi:hypothetical protein
MSGAPCPYVCRVGECSGVCVPGARQCSATGLPQTCSADGVWQSGAACPFVCSAGVCGGVCQPGQMGCSGTVPRTCNAMGAWQNGSACPFVCSAAQCVGVCTPGATRCTNNMRQTCDAMGAWQNVGTAATQLLLNPSFDLGRVNWTSLTDKGRQLILQNANMAHSASWYGALGGVADAFDDLYQEVAIPATATMITASFYYRIQTQEPAGNSAAPDTLEIYFYDADTGNFRVLAVLDDNMPTNVWTRFTVTLPQSVAGRIGDFGFTAYTDDMFPTTFYVDTVTLEVNGCTATP